MKRHSVLMVPDYRSGNPYQHLLENSLKENKWQVIFDDLPSNTLPLLTLVKKYKNINVIHMHWIASILERTLWTSNDIILNIKILLLMLDCWLVRLLGVKVIWTIHNKYAHQGYDQNKELKIRRIYAHFANRIIVHSKDAMHALSKQYGFDISRKTAIIFHGNYDGCYPKPSAQTKSIRNGYRVSDEEIMFLHFGRIRKYKGLEQLVNAYTESDYQNSKLFIAGYCDDTKYIDQLRSDGNNQIIFDNRYLSEQDLADYIIAADIVVLPFTDTLTSGSCILTMTFGKPLILPESAKVFGCVPENGVLYFKSKKDLVDIFKEIRNIDLPRMGAANKCASDKMDWDTVAKLTIAAYSS